MIINISQFSGGIDIIAESGREGAFLKEHEKDVFHFLAKFFNREATPELVEEIERELNNFYKGFEYKNHFWDNSVLKELDPV